GAGAPTKTITPGRGELKPVPPGRDEHQLLRSAAGELAHRASWRAKLFAPGAGAPTRLRRQRRGELIESDRGPWARRSPRGVAHPRQANPSQRNPGKDEHQLVRDAAGELTHRASWRATLFAPGAGAPTKTITPGRGELKPVPPGRDEHQLVRGAAGGLAHRASRRATLFAPGAGAPTRPRRPGELAHRIRSRPVGSTFPPGCSPPALRQPEPVQSREGRAPARPRCSRRTRPSSQQGALRCSHPGRVLLQHYDNRESELIESDRGPWARRSPRGVAHPRYANPSRCNPGKDEHQLVRDAAGGLTHRASRRTTLFTPGAGAPTRPRRPGERAYAGAAWEGRAPARPRCSRRTRPSSQLARYAVRTRGGCSYKATMPRRKATMPRRGELIATLHPKDDVIFPILIRHAAFRQHPPGLGDAGLVHGLRISADQGVPRRQIFPFSHQAVGAGRGKPGELRGAGRGQLHAVGHMLAPVGIVTAAAGLEVQQLAGDARVVDSVGVILVLELLQAAQTAAVA